MKIDDIVKQELWRSIAIYFFFLLFFIYLYKKGYILIEAQTAFIYWILRWIHHILFFCIGKHEIVERRNVTGFDALYFTD